MQICTARRLRIWKFKFACQNPNVSFNIEKCSFSDLSVTKLNPILVLTVTESAKRVEKKRRIHKGDTSPLSKRVLTPERESSLYAAYWKWKNKEMKEEKWWSRVVDFESAQTGGIAPTSCSIHLNEAKRLKMKGLSLSIESANMRKSSP